MNKQVRLSEGELQSMISEAVGKILKENGYTFGKYTKSDISPEEKKRFEMEDDWQKIEDKPFDYNKANDDMYNHNVHNDAFKSAGSKITGRLHSFDDSKRGESARKFNGTMDSLRKKNKLGESDESRFLKSLMQTRATLHHEYEKWQYSTYKPQGMEEVIDAILNAKHMVEDIIDNIQG